MSLYTVDKLPNDSKLRDPAELESLISELNERLEVINDNFLASSGGGGYSAASRTAESGESIPVNPWTYSSTYVDVRNFLDPLQIELRLSQLRVNQAMMAANSVGLEQLQADSVTARNIQALTITGDKIFSNTITADKLFINELSAISANLGTILAGNMTLDSAGFIRTGSISYNSGAGLWVGYTGGTYKVFIGQSGGNKILWDGSTLSITGGYSGTIDWSTIIGTGKPADYATVGATWGTNVYSRPTELTDGRISTALSSSGLVVSGVKPGVVVSPGGTSGLYLGSDYLGFYNGSAWKTYMDNAGRFYLGGTSGALLWDGTNLTVSGTVYATAGSFTGTVIANSGSFTGSIYSASGYFGSSVNMVSIGSGGLTVGSSGSVSGGSGDTYFKFSNSGAQFGNNNKFLFTSGVSSIFMAMLGYYGNTQTLEIGTRDSGGYSYCDINKYYGGRIFLDSGLLSALITFDNDTNLYREAANVLKTDDTFSAANIVVNTNYGEVRFTYGGSTVCKIYETGGLNLYGDSTHPVNVNNSALNVSGDIATSGTLKKITSDGWTPMLYSGSNNISFQYSGSSLKVKIDMTEFTISTS